MALELKTISLMADDLSGAWSLSAEFIQQKFCFERLFEAVFIIIKGETSIWLNKFYVLQNNVSVHRLVLRNHLKHLGPIFCFTTVLNIPGLATNSIDRLRNALRQWIPLALQMILLGMSHSCYLEYLEFNTTQLDRIGNSAEYSEEDMTRCLSDIYPVPRSPPQPRQQFVFRLKSYIRVSGGFRGQLPPSPSWNRSGAPFWEFCAPFEELTFDIYVEEKTPQYQLPPSDLLSTRPWSELGMHVYSFIPFLCRFVLLGLKFYISHHFNIFPEEFF